MALTRVMVLADIVLITLEAVTIFSFLGEVQGKSHLYRWSPAKSFSVSSSMVASWWPTTFLPFVGPGRVATIWGFLKAPLLTEAVTMSLGVTPVASKFSLPIEAFMVKHTIFLLLPGQTG